MSKIEWNEAQRKVIDITDGNMIVSASAGSGKTTVMLERVLQLIISGVPIKRICILAFNNAIASEIRQKLYTKILDAIENKISDNIEFLCEQLDDINLATIATNDAFCNKTAKEFFYILGIDPSNDIVSENERKVMFATSFDTVIERMKEQGEDWIYELVAKFNGEQELKSQISKIHNFAGVHPNKVDWLDNIKNGLYLDDLSKSSVMKYFFDMVRKKCDFAMEELAKMRELCVSDAKLIANVDAGESIINSMKVAGSYQELKLACDTKFPNRATVRQSHELYYIVDEIKYLYDNAKYVLGWVQEFCLENYDNMELIHRQTSIDVRNLLELYDRVDSDFGARKLRAHKVDFAQISGNAIEILKNDEISELIRARYDYICIDEYQDTNYLQEFMFGKITNGHNLFMVGDSKQSIYKFRLTEPAILLNKVEDYNKDNSLGTSVHLGENYRSAKGVIDFVNDIFSQIMTKNLGGLEYNDTDKLEYGAQYIDSYELPAVAIAMFKDVENEEKTHRLSLDSIYSVEEDNCGDEDSMAIRSEGEYIAKHIKSIVGIKHIFDIKLGRERLIRYGDCAILSSSGGDKVKQILNIIQQHRIPVDTAPLVKINDIYEVEILKEWLKVIDNDEQDYALCAVLTSYWIDMDYQELTDIRHSCEKAKFYYQACKLEAHNYSKLAKFYQLVNNLRVKASNCPISELVRHLVYSFGYDKFLMSSHNCDFKLNAVKTYINNLDGLTRSMSLTEYLSGLTDESYECSSRGDCDIVHSMTIHKSKGLEFPVVYLCNITDKIDKSSGKNVSRLECHNDIGIAINYFDEKNKWAFKNFVFNVFKEKNKIEQKEEKMRLFYVALTRARNHLVLTGTVKKCEIEAKVPYKVNSFWDWVANVAVNNSKVKAMINFYDEYGYNDNSMDMYNFCVRNDLSYPIIDKMLDYEYPYNKSTKISIKYSVTEINNLDSYEDNLEKVYDFEQDFFGENQAIRGTNYHAILENINYECESVAQIELEIDRMVAEGILSEDDSMTIDKGEILNVISSPIIKYASQNKHYREQEFMLYVDACEVMDTDSTDKVLVQGAIDLIIDGEKLIVVDFKKSNQPSNTLRERYRKQVELYRLATEEALGRKVDYMLLYVIGRGETVLF